MHPIFAFFAGLLLSFMLSATPPIALAQVHPSQSAAARALFDEGVILARAEDYLAASDRFRRAYALRPSAPIAFNLAASLVHLGALVEASEIFARLARDTTATDALRSAARAQRAEIEARFAYLTLRVTGGLGAMHLELDAHALPPSVLDVEIPVDPGEHDVRLLREDDEVTRAHLRLADGEHREVVLGAEDEVPPGGTAPAPAPASEPLAAAPPSGNDDGVLIGVGVGVGVALVAGVVILVVLFALPAPSDVVLGNTMPGVLTW